MKEISHYYIGDMKLIYCQGINRKGYDIVGMKLIPLIKENCIVQDDQDLEPLIQVKLIGDDYPFHYSHGRTMRNSASTMRMHFDRQYLDKQVIVTELKDERGILYQHFVDVSDPLAIGVSCCINNQTDKLIRIEMMSSFTVSSITPFSNQLSREILYLHQIRSTWANEGRLITTPIEEFQLEPSWKPSGANCMRFGQIGSMPNREYFPFIGIEDRRQHVCWGVQLCIGSSWQLEAYRQDNHLSLSGGVADREFGHWIKNLQAGQKWTSPMAIVSVVNGDVDQVSQRITRCIQNELTINESEKSLPIVFNEFCTTWGNPSQLHLQRIIHKISSLHIGYFVIDCGWYKQTSHKDDEWNIQHGDWLVNKELFPDGIENIVKIIHEHHMKAGIWFELETCGRQSRVFHQLDMLFMRDGYPITVGNRRFLNMLSDHVIEYLDQKVLNFLKEKHFDYIKIDYNANLGMGSDDLESMGESLYQSVKATQTYFKKLRETGFIIENCAAGGHRLTEPFLKRSDMSSFSDAHESLNIPIIAANLHRMIPIRQSQIWVVLQPSFPLSLIYYKLTSAFLGRMCLSGNICDFTYQQWDILQKSISFYQKISPIIDLGTSEIIRKMGLSYKEPTGYQIIKRYYQNEILIIIHTFEKSPKNIQVKINDGHIQETFMIPRIQLKQQPHQLIIQNLMDFDGLVIWFKENNNEFSE